MEELQRLNKISQNNTPSEWEIENKELIKICSLNCRSLRKHHEDIAKDDLLMKSDIICLNETWEESDYIRDDLQIPHYELHLNSKGNGKGVATYFRKDMFKHEFDVKEDYMQLSKFTSKMLDIITLYRSQSGDFNKLIEYIDLMSTDGKPLLVLGDFNFCFMNNKNHRVKQHLKAKNFSQLIREPTHIQGHLLDHAYLQDKEGQLRWTTEIHSKYFTDHRGIAIILKKDLNNK